MGAFRSKPGRVLAALVSVLALCMASVAIADVVTGTNGPDNLTGTNGDDTISALSGADTVAALGGHDSVNGGFGDDDINAGAGTDSVFGASGADTIVAEDDPDCNPGTEVLSGGVGNDTVTQLDTSGPGCGDPQEPSVLNGNLGADTLNAADGDAFDTLDGGAGPFDVCIGDPGDTYINCEVIDDSGPFTLAAGGGVEGS